MLILAVVMPVEPALINNGSTSLLIFLAAFGLTGLVLILHRMVLPRVGIRIGSEMQPHPVQKHPRRRRA